MSVAPSSGSETSHSLLQGIRAQDEEAWERLVRLYERWNKKDAAATWRAKRDGTG